MIDEKKLIREMWDRYNGHYNNASRFSKEETEMANRVLSELQKAIEEHPKVGDWIPVSEMLPEEEGEYLASREHYEGYDILVLSFDPEDGIDVEFWKDEIDAWMPLPAPFIESED